jgi:eukaryotic-like serine/threonine-protein kinase
VFFALTGQLPVPFTGDVSDYIARLARVEVSDIETLRTDLSADRVAIVRRMLHPQSARRPRNGSRLNEALEAIA